MTHNQVFNLIKASCLSYEEFGQLVGVSGMTFRRWLSKPKSEELPKLYVPAVREACYQLIANGTVSPNHAAVRAVLTSSESAQTKATLNHLGIPEDTEGYRAFLNSLCLPSDEVISSSESEIIGGGSQQMIYGITAIGTQPKKQLEVEAGQKKLFSFQNLGAEWARRISILWNVLQTSQLTQLDKVVAYGALFYLLTPIDLIPDHIPLFGLVDDFGVLGLAVGYYHEKFPGLR